MDARTRVRICKLIEKLDKHPELAKKLEMQRVLIGPEAFCISCPNLNQKEVTNYETFDPAFTEVARFQTRCH